VIVFRWSLLGFTQQTPYKHHKSLIRKLVASLKDLEISIPWNFRIWTTQDDIQSKRSKA